jgi:enamine deaminase RidA (YjgF/YER057c/UK114 family)
MRKRHLSPDTLHKPFGYSHVVEVTGGRLIFIAGQVALDTDLNTVGAGDLRAQTEQVFANIGAALAAVGADFKSLVKMTTYLTDMSQVAVLREVRDKHLDKENPPASTAIQVSALARPEWLVEIEVVASLPD